MPPEGLFQTTLQNITLHIGAIDQEGELNEDSTRKEYLQVRQEGTRRTVSPAASDRAVVTFSVAGQRGIETGFRAAR
jgi:hypothetical protein